MNRWVVWGLVLVLASSVAQAQPSPGLTSASRGVVKTESSSGYVMRQHECRPPAKPRIQAKAGCRHRDPYLGILRFAPGLGRDTAGALQSDGYAGHGEVVRIVLNPGGPGPPVPETPVRFRPFQPVSGNAFPRPFQSSRPFLRRDG